MAGELIKAGDVLKIGTRLEFYVEEDEEKYLSRIEDVEKDDIVAAMPLTRQRVPVIPHQGARLYGLAIGNQCRYRFMTVFKGTGWTNGNIPIWHVKMPEKVEKFQNREFVRVKVSQRIHVRLIDPEGGIGDPLLTWTYDISGSGVSFLLRQPVEENTKAGLEIHDIPDVGTLSIMSRIVRCTKQKTPDGGIVYRVGACFIDMPRATVNKIVKYLFAVQRRAIAKGISL